jgi:hypothetical protein
VDHNRPNRSAEPDLFVTDNPGQMSQNLLLEQFFFLSDGWQLDCTNEPWRPMIVKPAV